MKNRLKLDFSLETAQERVDFINTYVVQFTDLTEKEAETIANYLLWGKTTSGEALGADVGLETKWTKKDDIDSLDSLMESQTFNDLQIHGLNDAPVYKKPRVVFSRSRVRKNAPEHILKVFEELWQVIDRTDLLINYYELKIGKRINPPREELLKRFTEEERREIEESAQHLNQYQYLKQRHYLVEKRKEQFTLQDSFMPTVGAFGKAPAHWSPILPIFGENINVLPLGLNEGFTAGLVFRTEFDPKVYSEKDLWVISKLLQQKEEERNNDNKKIDFCDPETIYQLYLYEEDLENQIEEEKEAHYTEGNLEGLLKTLKFYEEIADLTDIQREILKLKEEHKKNQDIAGYINKKYGKSYTANYISTIFKQKIITKITEAALLHKDTIENCFYEENFKACTCCGRILLLDSRNWVKKARSKDGFQNRCKICEREMRKKKKEDNL